MLHALSFKEMMKYDSTITVTNIVDNNQIQLAHDVVPTLEGIQEVLYSYK